MVGVIEAMRSSTHSTSACSPSSSARRISPASPRWPKAWLCRATAAARPAESSSSRQRDGFLGDLDRLGGVLGPDAGATCGKEAVELFLSCQLLEQQGERFPGGRELIKPDEPEGALQTDAQPGFVIIRELEGRPPCGWTAASLRPALEGCLGRGEQVRNGAGAVLLRASGGRAPSRVSLAPSTIFSTYRATAACSSRRVARGTVGRRRRG